MAKVSLASTQDYCIFLNILYNETKDLGSRGFVFLCSENKCLGMCRNKFSHDATQERSLVETELLKDNCIFPIRLQLNLP